MFLANKDIVLSIFKSSSKPLKPGDIAATLGIDSKEVSKIIKDLREEGKVYSPKRCYYALKE
jgi:predicted transcriptional regulator